MGCMKLGKVWQAGRGEARLGEAGLGLARRGGAWQAWQGSARRAKARRGMVRLGRRVKVGSVEAWMGVTWRGRFGKEKEG